MTSISRGLAALTAGLCTAAISWNAQVQAQEFQYRIPISGLRATHSPETPNTLALSLAAHVLPEATRNESYFFNFAQLLTMSGEPQPPSTEVAWSVASGTSLPLGLELTDNGLLSGTPTTAGQTNFEIIANYADAEGRRAYQIVVNGYSLNVVQISAGAHHTCAVTATGGVKCWGLNGAGQLGNGSTTSSLTPVDVSGLTSGVASISAGDSHTCAVTTSGAALCWGLGADGRLGHGSGASSQTPVGVLNLDNVASISAGAAHTCAVTIEGGAKCWGAGASGRLGNNSNALSAIPVNVHTLTSGVASISAGFEHSCAVTTSGGAKCWGTGTHGKLGNGYTTTQRTPVDVGGGLTSGVASITAGHSHTCAVTTSGGAKCWGHAGNGQLGNGYADARATPVNVSGLTSGVVSISARRYHSCAVLSEGAAKCWGTNNDKHRLGNNSTAVHYTPVGVSGLESGVSDITTGTDHTCAITTAGAALCWGSNGGGLGNSAITLSSAPLEVEF